MRLTRASHMVGWREPVPCWRAVANPDNGIPHFVVVRASCLAICQSIASTVLWNVDNATPVALLLHGYCHGYRNIIDLTTRQLHQVSFYSAAAFRRVHLSCRRLATYVYTLHLNQLLAICSCATCFCRFSLHESYAPRLTTPSLHQRSRKRLSQIPSSLDGETDPQQSYRRALTTEAY
jgi:hypothetical protein